MDMDNKLSNYEIYLIGEQITQHLTDLEIYIPIKANFTLQKNIQEIMRATQEIESARLTIAAHYGVLDEEEGIYKIPEDKMIDVNRELSDLFSIEQNLNIKKINIEAFGDVKFTPAQMQAIMFMIED